MARPNDKLVVGTRMICSRKRSDTTERSKSTDVDPSLRVLAGRRGVHYSPTPATA